MQLGISFLALRVELYRLNFVCVRPGYPLKLFNTDPQKYLDEIEEFIVCPSCLAEKPKEFAVKLEIGGQEVHFCRCPHCHESFKKDPDFYIGRLEGRIPNVGMVLDCEGSCTRP